MGYWAKQTIVSLLTATAGVTGQPVRAQGAAVQRFEQPAQTLADGLRQVATRSGWEILFSPDDVAGLTAPALNGAMTPHQAVDRLIARTGLTAEFLERTIVIRGRSQTPAALMTPPVGEGHEIVVTGSRIRGAQSASPVTTVTRQQIASAGQNNLGEVVRALPQNFGGGQNPGVAAGAAGIDNFNLTGASTLNLRGLGQDATLTLLNGHRLSYGSASQGVDISAIPVAAVDRLEVVTDGASAIYGSDAVGGVANIILSRDFKGLVTSARLGAATEGGYFQQQYNAVAGTTWPSGGVLVAYDFNRNAQIRASQRSYTDGLDGSATLLPEQRQHSAVASLHQNLTSSLEFSIDGFYSNRSTSIFTPLTVTGDYRAFGIIASGRNDNLAIAPALKMTLSPRWSATASFVYGRDRSRYDTTYYSAGSPFIAFGGCYCNNLVNGEVGIEGAVVDLPAGELRLAAGGGYRSNRMINERVQTSFDPATLIRSDFTALRDSYYGFGELQAPLIAPGQDIHLVHRLTFIGALRYEDYPGIASLATPKLGLVYAPLEDLDLKISWGKSFKAPTLYQQFVRSNVYLFPASDYSSSYPAGATVLAIDGGNRLLNPERATSWTATMSVHPRIIPGMSIDVGYFHIDYSDRIVQPLLSTLGALANPAYDSFVTVMPSAAQLAAALTLAPDALINNSGGTYNPASVVGIVDNRFSNAARQRSKGLDLAASYNGTLEGIGEIALSASGTWLSSRRQLIAGEADARLAGLVFNPPGFRGRTGGSITRGRRTLSAFINRTAGVDDERREPYLRVGGQTTIDATFRYALGRDAAHLRGLELIAAVTNAFDAQPAAIRTSSDYYPPYDSTNYSAIGRVLSLTISKRW